MESRRNFLKKSFLSGSLVTTFLSSLWAQGNEEAKTARSRKEVNIDDEKLKEIYAQPVLKKELFPEPVIIESLDLIMVDDEFLVRARSEDGAEGYAVSNWGMSTFYPIFINHVSSFFKSKDARDLDQLIDECFIDSSHYKMQSMAIWTPIASAEFAILDLLGQVIKRPVYEILGELVRPTVEIYWANNYRGQSAEESVRQIVEKYEKEKPPAVKVKIAGRMGSPEVPEGRTEKMIPLLRDKLGDEVVIYADANGGYDVKEAIRIGKLLEENKVGFFEEPCPFYELWETKEVADNLDIPVAAGEQESSSRRFRWMVANNGAQVLQPDLFYYGGLTRSIRVARMADAAGMQCTPHVSGGGMNMLYIVHFASMVSNAGPHQEYKAPNDNIQYEIIEGNIAAESGRLKVPSGPGLGFELDPDWIASGRVITRKDLL
jgi:L-alanine-DL-glutamate epimerase-like enolase superfamily enzyme